MREYSLKRDKGVEDHPCVIHDCHADSWAWVVGFAVGCCSGDNVWKRFSEARGRLTGFSIGLGFIGRLMNVIIGGGGGKGRTGENGFLFNLRRKR